MTLFMLAAYGFICAAVYHLCPAQIRWAVLLLASYGFYASRSLAGLPFILLTTVSTWLAALVIAQIGENGKAQTNAADRERKKAIKAQTCLLYTSSLYLDTLKAQLELAGAQTHAFILPAGETTKCMAQLERIYDALIDAHITRKDFVIALGGGVVGDITGDAACTYLRGARFIQVPTTLLAQVDSSVGGKVAVNHPRGKNLLGAFYQPELVLIDCDTLRTLDARQVGAGLGEVIKYGCIADKALFETIERLGSRAALMPRLDEIVARCCAIKARYVHEDPHDHGVRMQLNFGHTLAHALENTMGYGVLLHGEAVCIGMVAAAKWGETLGVTPEGTSARIERVLKAYDLPTERDAGLTRAQLAATIALDKKAEGDGVRCVILTEIGACTGVVIESGKLAEML